MNYLVVSGVKLIADGDRIVSSVQGGKPFEPESLTVWEDICSHGGTVLDIGAYTGLYAIAAAQRRCHVIAFEPLLENRRRFRVNAILNGVVVRANAEVVSDEVGDTTITVNPNVTGLTSGASLIRKNGQHRQVKSVTVDSLLLGECVAMKIDVERAEPLVLRGAQDTLQRLKPALLVEVLGDDEKAAVRAAVPFYRVKREMDGRNWLMVAR